MNEDMIISELAELKTAVAAIAQGQQRIERILTGQSGSLAVLVAHDAEHKKKSAAWQNLLLKKLFPEYRH